MADDDPPGVEQTDSRTTSDRILDAAERLTQTRGFNGFSYADISAELGITTASIHYHFRTKAELGRELVGRYSAGFAEALAVIDSRSERAPETLARYVHLYLDVLRAERICLCGMLAAEVETLPTPMADEIRRFFDFNEKWLEAAFERGRREGTLRFQGLARDAARMLLGALEGAMLVSRPFSEPARFEVSAKLLLDALTQPSV